MSNPMEVHGAFSWNELTTDDVDAAVSFYGGLYGWHFEDFPMPDFTYKVIKAGDTPIGGIMPKPAQEAPCQWTAYVTVNDVDTVAETVTASGGQVVVPPFDIPQVGRACVLMDPQGASLAMITYLPQQEG